MICTENIRIEPYNPGKKSGSCKKPTGVGFLRKEVVDHIFDQILQVLDQGNIEYVKWDMNRSLMDVFSRGTKDQGRVMYDYVIGLYDFLERIVTRYPDLADRRMQWRRWKI